MQKKYHYGWTVSVGCSLILFYSLGLVINSFSVFLYPIIDSLNLSNADGSSILSIQNTSGVLAMVFSGKIYKRFNVRLVSFICGLVIATGYLLFFFSNSLSDCYFAAIFIGAGWGGGSMIPVSILLTEWFNDSRGIAFGIATAGSGVATMIYPAILTEIIIQHGLPTAFFFQASSIAILAVIAHLMVRNKPEDKNMRPYEKTFSKKDASQVNPDLMVTSANKEIPYCDVKKTKCFYQMILTVFLLGFSVQAVITHFSVLLTSFGYNMIYTGYMVSLFGIFMIIGKVLYGLVIDYSKKMFSNIYIFCLWLLALTSVFFLHLGGATPVLFSILVGLGAPIGTIGIPLWTEHLFGKRDYTLFYTTFKVSFNIGSSFGLLLPGIVADMTGSYFPAFAVYIFSTCIAFYTLSILYKKKKLNLD